MHRIRFYLTVFIGFLFFSVLANGASIEPHGVETTRWAERFHNPVLRPTLSSRRVTIQDKLLELVKEYAKKTYVPYIWGGGRIGQAEHCHACRKCVAEKRPHLKQRLQICKPCQYCGIDCSHFVYRLMNDAGLDYDYASSWELSRQTNKGLLKHYNLVDIGRNLSVAQPGDILVYKRHITMLTRVIDDTHGDIVHASRFRGDRLMLGGFRWDKNINLKNFRGNLIRILRHKDFFVDSVDFIGMEQVRWKLMPQLLWTGVDP